MKGMVLPESDITLENLSVVKDLVEWAEVRDEKFRDCAGISSSQVGCAIRCLAFWDSKQEDWLGCLNPYITEVEGDAFTVERKIVNLPKNVIRLQVHPICVLSYDNLAGQPESYRAEKDVAIILQALCYILDGRPLEVMRRDWATVRKPEKKKINARCPVCGKKNKLCSCGDLI